MAFAAPRILNEPIDWRFSSLRYVSVGASSKFSRTRGIRRAAPAMRSRADQTSSSETASAALVAFAPQLDPSPFPRLHGSAVDEVGCGQILDRQPQGLEEGDLMGRGPPFDLPEDH